MINSEYKNENLLILNEVDCYSGNAYNIHEYATDRAVQHQFILLEKGEELTIGRRNKTDDDDRGERIVLDNEVTPEFINEFKKAIKLKGACKSEYCNSIEEYNEASKFNEPIKKEIRKILDNAYSLITIDVEKEVFIKHSIY